MENRPQPVVRASAGRWLGGVCQGLGEARSVSPAWLRVAVVGLTLFGGLGAIVYLAAWLILPSRSGDAAGTRGIVVLAKALAGLGGLVVLGAAGAAATVFGFGWIVFGVAAAAFIGALSVKRLGLGWALLPVVALTVPAAALAAGGVQLTPTGGTQVVNVPLRALTLGRRTTYRSGLGTLLLDLRHTPLPQRGTLTLHIRAGVRRTIVALPDSRCVNVIVERHVDPFPIRAASLLTGRADPSSADLFLFGRDESDLPSSLTHTSDSATRPGPTLVVDFASEGGSLYVRDYPDDVDPDLDPYWPGFPTYVEPRPHTRGLSKRLARYEVRAWRERRVRELAARRFYLARVGGPCAPPATAPAKRTTTRTPLTTHAHRHRKPRGHTR